MDEISVLKDLSILGNAAAIPIIIGVTQLLKKNFAFKYKSDLITLFVSVFVCLGLFFYNTPQIELIAFFSQHWIPLTKGVIKQLVVAFATWLSASKSYDLLHGNKKRANKVIEEKKVLEEKIVVLQNGNGGNNEEPVGETDLSSRLREVLEEGS